MHKLWFGFICFLCVLTLLLCTVLYWLGRQAPEPAWRVGDAGGRVAVWRVGSAEPERITDIYTHLLPAEDVLRLQQGIPVQDEERLERLLEDLGL